MIPGIPFRFRTARHAATTPGTAALLALALAGCAPSGPGGGPEGAAPTSPAASTTGPGTHTATGGPAPGPAATPTTAPLTIFYLAVDDGGKSGPEIGCGDSVVPTTTEPVEHTDAVEAAITRLLADRRREHGESGLVNALHQSALEYVSSSVEGGTVTVQLAGQPVSGGTCDDPRIQEQLRYTAKAAAGVQSAVILLDGVPLEAAMSQK